jgi:hypothetical protein
MRATRHFRAPRWTRRDQREGEGGVALGVARSGDADVGDREAHGDEVGNSDHLRNGRLTDMWISRDGTEEQRCDASNKAEHKQYKRWHGIPRPVPNQSGHYADGSKNRYG